MAWYTGNALSNLVRVASCDFTNSSQAAFVMPVRGGTNYLIALDTAAGPSQSVRLEFQAALPNDNFRQRRGYASGTITSTTLSATAEPDEPAHGDQPAAHSVWWSWIASATGTVSLTVDGSGELLPRLSIYSGDMLTNLVLVAENSANGEIWPTVTFAAEARRRYAFAIDESTGSFTYSLSLRNPIAPPNDSFARPEPINFFPSSRPGTTVGANLEPDEPEHLHNAVSGSSVWYTLGGFSDRELTVLASGRRASAPSPMRAILPEPVVAVYEGASLASLKPVAAGVGSATFRTARFVKYHIAIASVTALGQDFHLSVLNFRTNDRFENAATLSEASANIGVAPAELRSATHQSGEPNHAGRASGHSLWWTWTAGRSGLYLWSNFEPFVTSNPSPIPLVTAVYTGTDLSDLTVVASNDWSSLTFPAEAGKRYYFALDLKDPRIPVSSVSGFGLRLSLSRYPTLLTPRLRFGEDIEFVIMGSPGQALSLEGSFDMIHWQPVRNITLPGYDYRYSEPSSLLSGKKFFRLLLLQDTRGAFGE
jgi:hypothetical protein